MAGKFRVPSEVGPLVPFFSAVSGNVHGQGKRVEEASVKGPYRAGSNKES
jgi:hypothetical protein